VRPHERNLSSALATYLKSEPSGNAFPEHTVNYFERFQRIDEYLNEKIHPVVNQGAAVNSAQPAMTKPKWLTDHGPEHIATVIERASSLALHPKPVLTPYETYLLLLGIHFHDVGNIYGRENHERRITEVMSKIEESLIGTNKLEQRMIRDLAMMHGGEAIVGPPGNKDTIGQLKYAATKSPRIPLLAAILRMADELAEDHTRTSRFVIEGPIPPEAEAYHLYADRLREVRVEASEHRVELVFEITESVANRRLRRDDAEVYLFDEILRRTLKTHRESVYCARFMRHVIHIDHVRVTIKVCSDDYWRVRDKLVYVLREQGYPSENLTVAQMCPDLQCKSGAELIEHIKTLGPGIEGDE
jgi:hypothetical protein